jgi:hypothetical protein
MLTILLDILLYDLLVPISVAFILLYVGLRFCGKKSNACAYCAGAVALCGGFFAGLASHDWEWTPAWTWQSRPYLWIPYLLLIAATVGTVAQLPSVSSIGRWGLRLAAAGLAGWLLVPIWPSLQNVRVLWCTGIGAAILVLWLVLENLAKRDPGTRLPLFFLCVTFVASLVLELSANMRFAELAGILTSILGACVLIGYWQGGAGAAQGMVPGIAVVLPGLLLSGYLSTTTEVPLASFVLVLAAPCTLLMMAFLPLRGKAARWTTILQGVALLAPLFLALALAAIAGDVENADSLGG